MDALLQHREPRQSSTRRRWIAAAILQAVLATGERAAAQAPPQYEFAVSPIVAEPAVPIAGQPATLRVVIRSRALTPMVRSGETAMIRVIFLRVGGNQTPMAAEVVIAARTDEVRIGEPTSMSVPWIAEPGIQILRAQAEIPPDQRIKARDVRILPQPAPSAIRVADAGPARSGAVPSLILRRGSADVTDRTIRGSGPGDDPATGDRRVTTAPLSLIAARNQEPPPRGGLVLDVPLTIANADEVHAVMVRCSAFATSLGDLIGTGEITRPVVGGTFAEVVSVPIAPRPGRTRAHAVRYSCAAVFAIGDSNAGLRAQALAGAASNADRRAAYERQLGRPFAVFSDLAESALDRQPGEQPEDRRPHGRRAPHSP
jgi:hypothetical protein